MIYHLISTKPLKFSSGLEWQQNTKGLFGASIELAESDRQAFLQECRQQFKPDLSFGVVPDNFKAQAAFFDMDGTVIEQESLVELARLCGKYESVKSVTDRAMAGALSFESSLRNRVLQLAGQPAEHIGTLEKNITLCDGIDALMKCLVASGCKNYLITGGFVDVAKGVSKKLGMQGFHANRMEIIEDKISGSLLGEIVDEVGKDRFLQETCNENNYPLTATLAVGDGANDIPMLKRAQLSVGFRPKPVLYDCLDVHIGHDQNHQFLTAVLSIPTNKQRR